MGHLTSRAEGAPVVVGNTETQERLNQEVHRLRQEMELHLPAAQFWDYSVEIEQRLRDVEKGLQTHGRTLSSNPSSAIMEELILQREHIAQLQRQLVDSLFTRDMERSCQEATEEELHGHIGSYRRPRLKPTDVRSGAIIEPPKPT